MNLNVYVKEYKKLLFLSLRADLLYCYVNGTEITFLTFVSWILFLKKNYSNKYGSEDSTFTFKFKVWQRRGKRIRRWNFHPFADEVTYIDNNFILKIVLSKRSIPEVDYKDQDREWNTKKDR
ncbi:hypothetical protein U3516DRAFT_746373 [Neocallimastix sp. 'constans']